MRKRNETRAAFRWLRSEIEIGGGQGIGRDAGDLDVDDAIPIRMQLEARAASSIRRADQVAGRIEAVIGVELEGLIVGKAGIGVDALQDDEIAAGHAGAVVPEAIERLQAKASA